ncbi:hypothetical protein [Parageobacillus sp. G301]|uniref:hypothetical protein n=1 Tax=Parageobacillus sp. G301 TaxID=2998290 RepID=UPI002498B4E3|nr:hypothetical protein [Parageobacillus sp. G301]GLH64483.1 hypothetical protein PG301_23220 [Parageobacillus sp. G301]
MGKKGIVGTCALCKEQNVILEESHIIPKFVFRRIMKKSVTGFMRNAFNPNQRVQDGDKQYLLCGNCEDLFNTCETKFANNVFYPYKKGKLKEFEYEEWLNYFISSVNWRNLYLDILDFQANKSLATEKLDTLIRNEEILRDYLLGRRNDISKIENHIFFFDDIKRTDKVIADADPHTFFRHSSFGYTVICNDFNGYYVISNLSGILICTILEKSSIENWENTYVNVDRGKFEVKNQKVKSPVMGDIIDYMNESRKAQEQLSKEQQEKILKAIQNKPQKLINSEIYKNKLLDRNLREN